MCGIADLRYRKIEKNVNWPEQRFIQKVKKKIWGNVLIDWVKVHFVLYAEGLEVRIVILNVKEIFMVDGL